MHTTDSSPATRIKVGLFTIGALLLIGLTTVLVNDRPYWWRACQLVHINVEDASGLRTRSAVKSLGLEIGYLQTVELAETYVRLGICITERVEVLPATRAYIRSEGFLGDKFVELKPVKYTGKGPTHDPEEQKERKPGSVDDQPKQLQDAVVVPEEEHPALKEQSAAPVVRAIFTALNWLVPSAHAQDPKPARPATPTGDRNIPVEQNQDMQNIVKRVDSLVDEMTNLTNNLRGAINPDELRSTMRQLNRTLENASRTLAPEGGLNQTAQRTLAKLEDAIEQMRDQMTRMNQGEGSIGMLLNDPTYAEEIREVIRNANKLLSRVGDIRFALDIGGEKMEGYDGSRGWFKMNIWPRKDRYYHLGVAVDARGKRNRTTTTTISNGVTNVTEVTTIEPTGLLLSAMVGKVFWKRLDLSIGAKYSDAAASIGIFAGPRGYEENIQIRTDIYARGNDVPVDARFEVIVRPYMGVYVRGGLESVRQYGGQTNWTYGAGVAFDDEDIKLLFALR